MAGKGAAISVRILGDAKHLNATLGKTEGKLKGFASKAGPIVAAAGAAAAAAAVAGGLKAVGAASDLAESANVVGLVWGDSAKKMEGFFDAAAGSLGMSESAAKGAAANIGGLLQNMGLGKAETADWSKKLLTLSADMGSAFNAEPADAIAAIGSGLRGESEPLKRFNVLLNDSKLKLEAQRLGLYSGKGALEDNAKAQAALSLITEQTSAIQGDFANTADGAANAQRVAAAQAEDLWAKVGGLLLPAYEALMGVINDKVLPGLGRFVEWLSAPGGVLSSVQGVAAGVSGNLGPVLSNLAALFVERVLPVLRQLAGYVTGQLLPALAGFVPVFGRIVGVVTATVLPILKQLGGVFVGYVLPILKQVAGFIARELIPIIVKVANNVVVPALQVISAVVTRVVTYVVIPALKALYWTVKNVVGPIFGWFYRAAVKPAMQNVESIISWVSRKIVPVFKVWDVFLRRTLVDSVKKFGSGFRSVWNGLKAAAAKPINFVIGTVYNNGLRKALNLIPGVNLGAARKISGYARGGILPGSSRVSDGDDQLVPLRRGEGITITEALDGYEKRRLLGLNAAVLAGVSPAQFRRNLGEGYASGGLVGFRGGMFTERFAQVLRAAEKLAGQVFNITQGGWRPTTSYSGTSHAGDAVDIARPFNTGTVVALRRAGVAAWDRTGRGNWIPHIHGIPLPGFGTAGGSGVWQAQDYLAGGDGLGGRDYGPRVKASGAGFGGIFGIPGLLKAAFEKLAGMSGPWGSLLKGGLRTLLSGVKDWILDKLGPLGSLIKSKLGGYASGTTSARPGWAWVGEQGPELVHFRGGERVHTAGESAALTGGVHIDTVTVDVSGMRDFAEVVAFLRTIKTSQHQGVY